jgi:hypothetical protein
VDVHHPLSPEIGLGLQKEKKKERQKDLYVETKTKPTNLDRHLCYGVY